MNIKELIQNPHPIYTKYVNIWNFMLNSYEGGIDYTGASVPNDAIQDAGAMSIIVNGKPVERTQNSNLYKHKKERPEDFMQRIRMSYYSNYCSPIVDIFTDHLFKQPIIEKFGTIENVVEKRSENIDRMGSSISEFRKSFVDLSQIYGHSYILVDMPKSKDEVSLEQRIENDQFPYFVQYHPQKVINWSLDQFGHPYWVLIKDDRDANKDWTIYNKSKQVETTYRLWTRNEWFVFNDKYEEIETGINPTGAVPLVCVKDKPSKKVRNFLGISVLSDIAFIARDVYNLTSELQEIIRNQTFAFLALQGMASSYDELAVGTSKAILYPPDSNAPQYISPPAENARVIMDQIDIQISRMFQLAKIGGESMNFKGSQAVEQSGVAKAWDFNQTNSALSKKADNYMDGELKAWQIFAKWEGTEFDGSIEYPKEFAVQDLMDDLTEAEELMKINLGKMVEKEIKSDIIKKKYQRKDKKEIDELISDMVSTTEVKEKPSLFNRLNNTTNLSGIKTGGFNDRN